MSEMMSLDIRNPSGSFRRTALPLLSHSASPLAMCGASADSTDTAESAPNRSASIRKSRPSDRRNRSITVSSSCSSRLSGRSVMPVNSRFGSKSLLPGWQRQTGCYIPMYTTDALSQVWAAVLFTCSRLHVFQESQLSKDKLSMPKRLCICYPELTVKSSKSMNKLA